MTEIPHYPQPKQKEDPVQRSLARPDACAKPCSMGKGAGVRVRPMSEKQWKKVTFRRKKRKHDYRDVHFF